MKKKIMLLPFMAIIMNVGMVCSCGNGIKKQVDASEDSVTVSSEDSPSNPFVGKYYKDEGNGGGIVSEMAISFLADGKCVCYSDFYQAYPNKEFIHGTYEAKDDKVIVCCLVDDTKIDYEFEIKYGGKTIGYDHSDPEMGNMGMDFMTLNQVDARTYAEVTDTTTYEADAVSSTGNSNNYTENNCVHSSSSSTSLLTSFMGADNVVGVLANHTFTSGSGPDIRFDGDGIIYIDNDAAGVVSVLRYSPKSVLLRYGGGPYGEGKIIVTIEDNGKMRVTDPVDGSTWYQKR